MFIQLICFVLYLQVSFPMSGLQGSQIIDTWLCSLTIGCLSCTCIMGAESMPDVMLNPQ